MNVQTHFGVREATSWIRIISENADILPVRCVYYDMLLPMLGQPGHNSVQPQAHFPASTQTLNTPHDEVGEVPSMKQPVISSAFGPAGLDYSFPSSPPWPRKACGGPGSSRPLADRAEGLGSGGGRRGAVGPDREPHERRDLAGRLYRLFRFGPRPGDHQPPLCLRLHSAQLHGRKRNLLENGFLAAGRARELAGGAG